MASSRTSGRRNHVLLATLAVAALTGLVVAIGFTALDALGADRPATVRVPPAGDVVADHVRGHPVFVVHDPNGEVLVLDAVSPHDPGPTGKVLVFCRTSGWFLDVWHGSQMDRRGNWTGGPAPTGMARHQVIEVVGDRAVVGARGPAPGRLERDGAPQEALGPGCANVIDPRVAGDPTVWDDLVLHAPPWNPDLLYVTPAGVVGPLTQNSR